MEDNKYFKELKQVFGFECYIGDIYNFKGKDVDYVCYESESAEGNPLYVFKEAGEDIQVMRDIYTDKSAFIEDVQNCLMDGDRVLVDDHLAMWLDMDNGSFPSDFWEDFYKMAVNRKYITHELV